MSVLEALARLVYRSGPAIEAMGGIPRILPRGVRHALADGVVANSRKVAGKSAGFKFGDTGGRNYVANIFPNRPSSPRITMRIERSDSPYDYVEFSGQSMPNKYSGDPQWKVGRAKNAVATMRTAADLLQQDAALFRPKGYNFQGSVGGGKAKGGLSPRDRIYRAMAKSLGKSQGYEVTRETIARDLLRRFGVHEDLRSLGETLGNTPLYRLATLADQWAEDIGDTTMRLRRISPAHQAMRDLYYPAAGGGALYALHQLAGGDR
jgi:hypothetical protein